MKRLGYSFNDGDVAAKWNLWRGLFRFEDRAADILWCSLALLRSLVKNATACDRTILESVSQVSQ